MVVIKGLILVKKKYYVGKVTESTESATFKQLYLFSMNTKHLTQENLENQALRTETCLSHQALNKKIYNQ